MKKKLAIVLGMIASPLFHSALAIESCDIRFKPLYKDILIYKQTEKITENEGVIRYTLHKELESMKKIKLSLKEKVHSIETSFAQCDMELNEDDQLEIDMTVEAVQKSMNPLDTE